MSDLAEYACRLHESERRVYPRRLTPLRRGSAVDTLKGVRAVIVDVYGTMVNYWRPGFEERDTREALLVEAFSGIVDRFGMGGTLAAMNPADPPAKTLCDFYNGLLALNRQKSAGEGAALPEIRVEEVWSVIALMLKRNGYDADARAPWRGDPAGFARCLAYTYNFLSMGRELYPGVAVALKRLKDSNMAIGILSDAQFYTPIDLTLMLRDQSGGKIVDCGELFDTDLTFLSYEYGFVKPSEALYRRLFDALYEYQITPDQTVVVGNDLTTDIAPAAALGMRTALFCGDDLMVFGKDRDAGGAVPDIIFYEWEELPERLLFHGGKE
ncbi:MAG: HAD family hydrolase [Chitinispirillales bacterium]|nr:HAD family hydrolase [Chitinispirillales bacterium]